MAKIKHKVEMTLPELIEWAWENEVSDKAFYSNLDGGSVYFDKIQNLSIEHEIAINETFTVEIEKEIDEDTVLPMFIEIFTGVDDEIFIDYHENENIKEVLEINSSRLKTKTFNLINNDGTMTLIWKDGAMVDD
ncbi:hypothetical protein KZX30_02830 [Staphylococcus haemolyticus]|uniref:hypothetical protein n=1 Tax=Staphylococcus haemolyticus TaxID=1283 RepID=UPI0011A365A5|nr:hypothetical protein [Staphylococcus haemolyticus]MCK6069079.1 hypothetical protein [Staphylococcus haemolyticus]MCK6111076.1 hypothetical protein [Staphylococcus haemolyticus]MCK6168585.1 hypothetical protein [Staphylococcus haemolyticus]